MYIIHFVCFFLLINSTIFSCLQTQCKLKNGNNKLTTCSYHCSEHVLYNCYMYKTICSLSSMKTGTVA